jgi:CTP:molybdopterin cytidylyltransferase MocA/broad specificity phosphatase PhoE
MAKSKDRPMNNQFDHLQPDVGVIILAAGYSSRMGQMKALMEIGGSTMLQRCITLFQPLMNKTIWVVTGHGHEHVAEAIVTQDVIPVVNHHYKNGMFSSIQVGLQHAKQCKTGCFLMPVDFPLVKAETITRIMEVVALNPGKWVVPTFHGKKGHPLFIPAAHFQEILEYQGENGLKAITENHRAEFVTVPVEDEGVVLDIDNPEAYAYGQAYVERGMSSESLLSHAKNRRFVLVRHGEPRQHKGKIFLGQTDIPLSEKGKTQAQATGIHLKAEGKTFTKIYTSDLARANQTAEIIATTLGDCAVLPYEFLREMDLGDWDGKDIEEIRQKDPAEYEYRGSHLMEYKRGNRAENFFDLQYRVRKGLIALLEKDNSKDIFIVAHQSVLRAIHHNLMGLDMAEPWKPMEYCDIIIIKTD